MNKSLALPITICIWGINYTYLKFCYPDERSDVIIIIILSLKEDTLETDSDIHYFLSRLIKTSKTTFLGLLEFLAKKSERTRRQVIVYYVQCIVHYERHIKN